jgi:hypothetical protein
MPANAHAILLEALRDANRWLDEPLSDPCLTWSRLVSREGRTARSNRMTLSRAFLAPEIVKAAVEGRLPRGFGTKRATQMTLESRGWIWPEERYPASARKYGHGRGMFADIARTRWSRAKVLKAPKKTLPRAADTLLAEPPA